MAKMLVIDGCDAAIIGHVETHEGPLVVYDYNDLVQVFIDQGMDTDGAVEWISFNIDGAYMGPGQPLILYSGGRAEVDEVAENLDDEEG